MVSGGTEVRSEIYSWDCQITLSWTELHVFCCFTKFTLASYKIMCEFKITNCYSNVQKWTYLKILHLRFPSGATEFWSSSRLTARRFGSGPWSWSIHCSIVSSFRASGSTGFTEMSLIARNWPQLFKCSFSSRKKFQMKRLKRENWEGKMRKLHKKCVV